MSEYNAQTIARDYQETGAQPDTAKIFEYMDRHTNTASLEAALEHLEDAQRDYKETVERQFGFDDGHDELETAIDAIKEILEAAERANRAKTPTGPKIKACFICKEEHEQRNEFMGRSICAGCSRRVLSAAKKPRMGRVEA